MEPWRAELKSEAASIDDETDPNEVPDYAFIAFEYFRAREQAHPVEPYLHKRPEINEKMRQVLVDWLVEVGLNHLDLDLRFSRSKRASS